MYTDIFPILILVLIFTKTIINILKDFFIAQVVKNLPEMQETWVQSLCQEDPLEKKMVIHSNIVAWRNPWTEEPGGLQSMGSQSQTRLSN